MTVDPRGLPFAAWLTAFVPVAVLVLGSGSLLLAQAAIFAIGACLGCVVYLRWRRFTVRRTPSRHFEGAHA